MIDHVVGGDVDLLHLVPGGSRVGDIDEAGIRLAGLDLAHHILHLLLLGDRVQSDSLGICELVSGLAAGDLGGADDEVGAIQRGVQAGDPLGIALGNDKGQDIGGELGLLAHQTLVDGVLHGGVVGGGQHVGGLPLGQGGHQVLGTFEVEGNGQIRVLLLDLVGDLREGLLERGGGQHGDFTADPGCGAVGGACCRVRGGRASTGSQ